MISIDLRTDAITIFFNNDVNFFEVNKSGALLSRIQGDVNQAKTAFSENLTFMIKSIVTIISTLVVMFIMSWKLTLAVFIIVPIYSLVTILYTIKIKSAIK